MASKSFEKVAFRWARRNEFVKEVKRWYDMEQELGLK
jgi:hypothetical protein